MIKDCKNFNETNECLFLIADVLIKDGFCKIDIFTHIYQNQIIFLKNNNNNNIPQIFDCSQLINDCEKNITYSQQCVDNAQNNTQNEKTNSITESITKQIQELSVNVAQKGMKALGMVTNNEISTSNCIKSEKEELLLSIQNTQKNEMQNSFVLFDCVIAFVLWEVAIDCIGSPKRTKKGEAID